MSGTPEYLNHPAPELRDAVTKFLMKAEADGEFMPEIGYCIVSAQPLNALRKVWMKSIGFENPAAVKISIENEYTSGLGGVHTHTIETDLETFLRENDLDSEIDFLDELARDGNYHFGGGSAAHSIVSLEPQS